MCILTKIELIFLKIPPILSPRWTFLHHFPFLLYFSSMSLAANYSIVSREHDKNKLCVILVPAYGATRRRVYLKERVVRWQFANKNADPLSEVGFPKNNTCGILALVLKKKVWGIAQPWGFFKKSLRIPRKLLNFATLALILENGFEEFLTLVLDFHSSWKNPFSQRLKKFLQNK